MTTAAAAAAVAAEAEATQIMMMMMIMIMIHQSLYSASVYDIIENSGLKVAKLPHAFATHLTRTKICTNGLKEGSGLVPLTHQDVQKKSIFRITNSDNLCLPSSICVALVHAKRVEARFGVLHSEWEKVRKSQNNQKTLAQKLINDACVVIPIEGCGINEIKLFQNFLAPTSLFIPKFRNRG